ncbi:isocitrate lyase [Woeseiaceae bacterium]|jgi:isocitrate lyase|nr:isocitrate lyase [Woeseiaceae bacterium]MDB2543782.1 isocitrate lyase [Woeseiaceae bacterium]|tara:strand:- start:2365 stop:3645 length:1281 start_codon:yes stop_codon:yes gene_type:complete
MNKQEQIKKLESEWQSNSRWKGVTRDYSAADVVNLRGSIIIESTIAKKGAKKLWELVNQDEPLCALGALTGNQAIQEIQAGLKAIYCSGWQVAGDGNSGGEMYPDQSLYSVDSVPKMIERINKAFIRTDEIHTLNDDYSIDWFAPIIADAEAGFGGNLNAFELMKSMIKAGASGVHFEDQLSSAKKCGHMGGKVLVPTKEAISKLAAARLAADVMDVPTVLIARTDADAANLITSDIDEIDHAFLTGERTAEGFYRTHAGIDQAIARGLSYAPYVDLLWCETSKPDLAQAKRFADAIHAKFPNQLLAYNCSPSFNWKSNLDEQTMKHFREKLGEMGYKFQFITLAGWHALNSSMFNLSRAYKENGMYAYSKLQEQEFEDEKYGFRAAKHQSFVGAGYFDAVQNTIMAGQSSTTAMDGSTEEEQFTK